MRIVLRRDTGFTQGESTCFCGGTDLADKAASAGLLFGSQEEEDKLLEDTDWLRSDSTVTEGEYYNEMFGQDPGQSGPS